MEDKEEGIRYSKTLQDTAKDLAVSDNNFILLCLLGVLLIRYSYLPSCQDTKQIKVVFILSPGEAFARMILVRFVVLRLL
jgi:hypothetical protein